MPGSRQVLEAFATCLVSRWDELLQTRYQALQFFEIDQIHDVRVASRRLRGVIEQLGPFIGSERMERLRQPIRRLTRELGQVRNLDEARLYFEKIDRKGLEPLLASLSQRRKQESRRVRQLLATVNGMKMERQIRSAAAALVTPDNIASQGILAILSERNLQLYRPIYSLLPLVAAPEMVDERHALRIAIKKWRYFTELLHTVLAQTQDQLLELQRQYQSLLGDMNDRVVFSHMLCEVICLPETTRTRVQEGIAREQQKLLKKLCVLLDTKPLTYSFQL